jgi:ketosteroid isomerase-like protein
LALTQARWSLVGTDLEGERVEMDGEATVVSRRQTDGTWRIVMENPIR